MGEILPFKMELVACVGGAALGGRAGAAAGHAACEREAQRDYLRRGDQIS